MKLVPVVVLLEERFADLLDLLANLKEIDAELEPLHEIMEKNGWTSEMLLGGILLRQAITDEINGAHRTDFERVDL